MSGGEKKYYSISNEYGPEEFKEKGSRFISFLYPVSGQPEAEAILHDLRKKYHDASHVCYAYRLGLKGEEYRRSSDDGEPGGTAGMPIYTELMGHDFLNVLAVVVRYFGGTKLGVGGLCRAYALSAKRLVEKAVKILLLPKIEAEVDFPFSFTGDMMRLIQHFEMEILARTDQETGIHIRLAVAEHLLDKVKKAIEEKSSGKVRFRALG